MKWIKYATPPSPVVGVTLWLCNLIVLTAILATVVLL